MSETPPACTNGAMKMQMVGGSVSLSSCVIHSRFCLSHEMVAIGSTTPAGGQWPARVERRRSRTNPFG
jgi:hypothetical protein